MTHTVWMVQVHEDEAVADPYGFSFVPVLHGSQLSALQHAAKLRATIPDVAWKMAQTKAGDSETVWFVPAGDDNPDVVVSIRVMALTVQE